MGYEISLHKHTVDVKFDVCRDPLIANMATEKRRYKIIIRICVEPRMKIVLENKILDKLTHFVGLTIISVCSSTSIGLVLS